MSRRLFCILAAMLFLFAGHAGAQNYSDFNRQLVDEHIYGGMPGFDNIYIRQAYILSYNHQHRIPNWVAYHIKPGYTQTVPRYGVFSSYRVDKNIPNPVTDADYQDFYAEGEGFVRGHMAPFNISGGDRDGDGLLGVIDNNGDGRIDRLDMQGMELWEFAEDADELSRVYEINYLSNITPQDADGFNGGSGIWRDLERYIQQKLVEDQEKEVWVYAGTVLGKGEMKKVGPDKDITVPPMFYKIVIRNDNGAQDKPVVLAFLLPHHRVAHGDIQDFLVSVNIIEALTGLDFFRELDDEVEAELEATDTWENWGDF